MNNKTVLAWSGGKDSTITLHELKVLQGIEIVTLLTTLVEGYDRISMHGVREEMLNRQVRSLGIPLKKVFLSKNGSNKEYDIKMEKYLTEIKKAGILSVCFGDIFLDNVRKYRDSNLSKIGMKGIYPIWRKNTTELANDFIKMGFKSIITCVDSKALNKVHVGRIFDENFLLDLPDNVDPCGENGEFHTFVFDGPMFKNKIPFAIGEVILRDDRFYYCDLIP